MTASASAATAAKLARVLAATAAKVAEERRILEEYHGQLEMVGPAPGRPGDQHEAMVEAGLCSAAVRHTADNRYCNLFPYDAARVQLTGLATDYVNASWVSLPGLRHQLILAMAPLHPDSKGKASTCPKCSDQDNINTCPMFWRMVEQEEVKTIAMLCNVQPGFTGCSQYFPPGDNSAKENKDNLQCHGAFKVRNVSTKHLEDGLVVRELELEGLSGVTKNVRHMHFQLWPNYGVVDNVSQLASFVAAVYSSHEGGGPALVHCSGGVGRSGTLATVLALHGALRDLLATRDCGTLDPFLDSEEALCLAPLVCHLRGVRHPWMVEGEHQYLLAYQTCLHILEQTLAELQ